MAAPTAASPLAAARTTRRYEPRQLLRIEGLNGLSFAPDRKDVLVASDRNGVPNAWAIQLDGSAAVQLTNLPDKVEINGYFPRDERFLYTSDQGGNEMRHVYLRDLDGQIRDLTPGDKVTAEFVDWAADGRSFFIATNERDARFFDLYEYGGFGRRLVFQNDIGVEVVAISSDKRYIALVESHTTNDSDVLVFDTTTKSLRNLTKHSGTVLNLPQSFSPDGSRLFFTSNADGEFQALVRYDLVTDQREVVLRPDWDVTDAELSADRRLLIVYLNVDARTELRLFDAQTLRPLSFPELPAGDIGEVAVSRDGSMLALYAGSGRQGRDLYVFEFATSKLTKLTNVMGEVKADDLVEPEVVRYASLDGLTVPALLYRPHDASAERPGPAAVWVHGGPGGQSRAVYSDLIQLLVNHGYTILAVNNRGSSGYGKTFFAADDRNHGKGDLDDCVAGRRWLAAQPWVDPSRVAIMGGSYGGYMVLAALAFRPLEFAAGVDIYGVSNWLRTLDSMPAWWGADREAIYAELGDPRTDADYLRSISPLFATERIVRPLMVLQGANDPRVLKVESDEIVAALEKRNVPVEYLVFPDEGHGFAKLSNQEIAWSRVLAFLDRTLGTAATATATSEPAAAP